MSAHVARNMIATGHRTDTGEQVTGRVVGLRPGPDGVQVVYLLLPNDTHAVCYGAEAAVEVSGPQLQFVQQSARAALDRLDEAAAMLTHDEDLIGLFDRERASLRETIERLDEV